MVVRSITSIARKLEMVTRYLCASKLLHIFRVELYDTLGFYRSGDCKGRIGNKARTLVKPSQMREQDRKSGAHNWKMPITKLTVYVECETS
jgi:hypothetical protein